MARGRRVPCAERDRGAQAVEFGLIFAFVLVPLILGLIQLGLAFYSQITITQAAREAVRQLALNVASNTAGQCDATCLANAQSTAANSASPLSIDSSTAVYTTCPSGATQSTLASVKISAPSLLPLLPFATTVTGYASMPCGG